MATCAQSIARLFCAVGLLVGHAATAAPPPVEAFGSTPAVSSVAINPAGTRLAWIDHTGPEARVVVFDIAARREVFTRTSTTNHALRALTWAGDATLLVKMTMARSVERHFGKMSLRHHWKAIPVAGDGTLPEVTQPPRNWNTNASLVSPGAGTTGKLFLSTWGFSDDLNRTPLEHLPKGGVAEFGNPNILYEADIRTGAVTRLAVGTYYTTGWIVDGTGAHIVRSDWNPDERSFALRVNQGDSWPSLYEARGCGDLRAISIASKESAVVALGRRCQEDRAKLWLLPLDGAPMQPLVEDATLDVESVISDPLDGTVLAAVFAAPRPAVRWLDELAGRRISELQKSLDAAQISIVSRSADNQRLVVRAESSTHPPEFHLIDYRTKRADLINEAYPLLKGITLGSVRTLDYPARDGYPLVAYLTVPPGVPEKDLPLVVLPHDGPDDHDKDGFDWMAQFLASRGYAVLQPQYRGSSGFGRAHLEAGKGQWGLRMQDDVTDAVHQVILQGIVNPNRVCIAGKGYGGYVALAGAAFTPTVYACAVSVAGISSLPLMARRTDWWREQIGSPTDADVLARSPSRNAANFRAPILLLHGTDDSIVPIQHSRQMAYALKRAGKSYEFIELKGEDYWLSNDTTRVQVLEEIERFLARNLLPSK